MDRNTTLFDIQPEVFQTIPKLIAEIDSKENNMGSIEVNPEPTADQHLYEQPTFAAAAANGSSRGNPFPRFPYRRWARVT